MSGPKEGREFRHSWSEDAGCTPQYVEIREDTSTCPVIDAELQALGYDYQWQSRRWHVWRNSR